jgi:hypothetical protein
MDTGAVLVGAFSRGHEVGGVQGIHHIVRREKTRKRRSLRNSCNDVILIAGRRRVECYGEEGEAWRMWPCRFTEF